MPARQTACQVSYKGTKHCFAPVQKVYPFLSYTLHSFLVANYDLQKQVPWTIILTKGDLLEPELLARCVVAVQNDLAQYVPEAEKEAAGVAEHGAGVGAGLLEEEEKEKEEVETSGNNEYDSDIEAAEYEKDEDAYSDEEEQDNDSDGQEESDEEMEGEEGEDEEEEEEEEEELPRYREPTRNIANRHLVPVQVVSSSTGAGVRQLWAHLSELAERDAAPPAGSTGVINEHNAHAVREHRLARMMRARQSIDLLKERALTKEKLVTGGSKGARSGGSGSGSAGGSAAGVAAGKGKAGGKSTNLTTGGSSAAGAREKSMRIAIKQRISKSALDEEAFAAKFFKGSKSRRGDGGPKFTGLKNRRSIRARVDAVLESRATGNNENEKDKAEK
jgi:hypothetical protein